MPQTYTFGPVGGVAGVTPPEEKKKQAYSFGPVGSVAKTTTPPADSTPVDIPALATKYGLDPEIIGKQVQQESGGKQSAVSPKGAVGIMQLMPETAKELGVDRHDPHQNAEGGMRLMQRLLNKYKGDYRKALAAYDAGEKHVDKAGGVPDIAETKDYVEKIMGPEKPPVAPPPVTPPRPPVDKSGIKSPGPFTSGVATGMGFDPKMLESVTKFKLGDKLYPVNHPMIQQGAEIVKQAAKGMGQWMEATAKDPFKVVDPLESMARVVEFHTGTKWDAFGLHKAGIEETALDEIGKGIKSGNKEQLEHGAGRLVGGLSTIFAAVEAPEVASKLKAVPGEVVETAKVANEARNKSVVTAAANNVLQHDAKNVIIPTIVQAVKNTQESIGRRVKNIADADRVDSAQAGRAGSFTRTDMATAIKDAVDATNAQKVPKPATAKVIKTLSRYGQDMSWEDLKDLRSVVGSALSEAAGKDRAVLGKLYDDYLGKMKARAVQLGKTDAFDEYVTNTRELQKHKDGIISKLQGADTGLKLYTELAKASNKPELNDMFNLLERHGGIPSGFVDELVKTRRPIFDLAKRADGGDASGGRLGALLRHPMAAGTAMVGTGLGLSLASPVPITGSFVASLIAAQKAANFMDRFDAVKAMRSIRRATPPNLLKGAPTPFPGGAGPSATPSGGGTPPSAGPVTPSGTSPVRPSAPVSPSVGAPAAPASLEELMGRVAKAQERRTPTGAIAPERRAAARMGGPLNIQRTYVLNEMRTKLQSGKLSPTEHDVLQRQYVSMKAHPEDLPPEGDLKSMKVQPKKMSKAEAEVEQVKRHITPNVSGESAASQEAISRVASEKAKGIKRVKIDTRSGAEMPLIGVDAVDVKPGPHDVIVQRGPDGETVLDKGAQARYVPKAKIDKPTTPYEEFGVKIDRERLTTPEAVREAKADAKRQIEELGRTKYTEAAKLPVGEARTAALDKLKKDVAQASRSVDKMQTPEVSRKQRDVLRKAVDAGKIKPAERSVLEEMSPEQVEQKASAGVTDDEANMMEMVDLGREAESYGGTVEKVYNEIYKKTGGDPRTSLPMLRALMEQVRKAKKPAAD